MEKVTYLQISYPNFVLGTTIDPAEANQNNYEIVTKINELVEWAGVIGNEEQDRRYFESERVSAESDRRLAEDKRSDAERIRSNNEDDRKSNETYRIQNENDRITQEDNRQTNEQIRMANATEFHTKRYAETYVASGGENTIPIFESDYDPERDGVDVIYRNLYLVEGKQFEIEGKDIQLKNFILEEGDRVTVQLWKGIIANPEINAHGSAHGSGGTDPIDLTDLPGKSKEVNKLSDKLLTHEARDVKKTEEYPYIIANFPTEGRSEVVHPSVVYIEGGYGEGSHPYWACVEPYPRTNDQYENPYIFRSYDGQHWESPEGINNPVVDTPEGDRNHLSDSELFYDEDSDMLYLYYRKGYRDERRYSIHRMHSSNGVDWSTPVEIFNNDNLPEDEDVIMSPTFVKEGDTLYVYLWELNGDVFRYQVHGDEIQYGSQTKCNFLGFSEGVPRHGFVHYDPEEGIYRMLNTYIKHGEYWETLVYMVSDNGIDWTYMNECIPIDKTEFSRIGRAVMLPVKNDSSLWECWFFTITEKDGIRTSNTYYMPFKETNEGLFPINSQGWRTMIYNNFYAPTVATKHLSADSISKRFIGAEATISEDIEFNEESCEQDIYFDKVNYDTHNFIQDGKIVIPKGVNRITITSNIPFRTTRPVFCRFEENLRQTRDNDPTGEYKTRVQVSGSISSAESGTHYIELNSHSGTLHVDEGEEISFMAVVRSIHSDYRTSLRAESGTWIRVEAV